MLLNYKFKNIPILFFFENFFLNRDKALTIKLKSIFKTKNN